MNSFLDSVKEHWEKGAAFVAIVFEAAMAFEHHLAELSLQTRFLTVAVAGLLSTSFVAQMLSLKPSPPRTGFYSESKRRSNAPAWSLLIRIVIILASAALAMFLLDQTATFHNIRLLQSNDRSNTSVGTIELQPSHVPTKVVLSLSTNQASQVKIDYIAPGSWNEQDRVDWRMQDNTPYGVLLILQGFKSPQVFGCWYRLSAAAGALDADLTVEPAEVRVLRTEQLYRYRRNIRIYGGFLCIVALVFWSYRSSWFRPSV